jgi:uncharacterized protein (TIGR00369 family)
MIMTTPAAPWRPRDIDAVTSLIDNNCPQARDDIGAFAIEQLTELAAVVRLPIDEKFIRPGGSVSGPTMFKIADLTAWVAIISERGPRAIDAVTANMTINFLARPAPHDLICHARLLRLGRRLAISECQLFTEGDDNMVAHATCTYAMPIA